MTVDPAAELADVAFGITAGFATGTTSAPAAELGDIADLLAGGGDTAGAVRLDAVIVSKFAKPKEVACLSKNASGL